MESPKSIAHNLTDNIKEYIETRIDIVKLDTAEGSSKAVSAFSSSLILLILGSFFLMLVSIGLAIFLGDVLDNAAAGFFLVSVLYVLIGILVYANRKSWIQSPILNIILKAIYHD